MSAVLPGIPPAAVRRRPAATGTTVEVLRDAAAMRSIVPEWEALAAQAAEPNPFYEHWMLLPALECYGAQDFLCAAVREAGRLAGLFPLRAERSFRGAPVRSLRSWRHRNMLACTPLVRAKGAASCILALLRSPLAPVVEFDWMAAGGFFYGALAEAATAGGFPWLVTDAYVRAIVAKGRDPRERYSSNTRNNLRRWESRLRAAGSLTPMRLAPGDDLEARTTEFTALEASGWKGRAGTALACREDDRRFVAATFPEAFRRGRLWMTGLDLDGRPLARHLAIAAGEGAFTLKLAYDEAHAGCSPGILGEVENVRQLMEAPGPRWLDSNTAAENAAGYFRAWKERHTVHRVAVGLRGAGRLAVTALPLLRGAKAGLRRLAAGSRGTK